MRVHEPSRTAEFMALFRASEHARPPHARSFADPLAAALLPANLRVTAGLFALKPLAACLTGFMEHAWPGARSSGVARTRLIDDWIIEAAQDIPQLVLLGAGFDTRAWRLDALKEMRVFEVDHPETARVKQQRLRAAGVDLARVTFVAVDFERDDFDAALRNAGFDPARRSIVVWEGVSQYLAADAVSAVMCWAGRLARGSRFIFTYVHAGMLDGSAGFFGADAVLKKVGSTGEPWRFGLLPEQVPDYLHDRGLALLCDLGADDYRLRVMGEPGRALTGYSFYHVVLAQAGDAQDH